MPIDKRLKMAMRPLSLREFLERHPTMFNWRIRAILGSGKWNTVPSNNAGDWGGLALNIEDFTDFCCSIQEGKWK